MDMKRLAVLGRPVAHSLSPAMHTAALRELGLGEQWAYEAIEVAPEDFERLARSLPASGFAGVNVTIPHKRAALELADAAGDAARAIGAANTLSFPGGRIEAENTDAPALLDALPTDPRGRRALVLGAGGAARAAAWALAGAGAEVAVWNRTAERAEALASELGVSALAPEPGGASLPVERFEVLVNATSVGLQPPVRAGEHLKALRLDADSIDERHVLVDLVYAEAQTELVEAARSRGASTVDGREILVRQGARSLRIWTGREPPLETMRDAIRILSQEASKPAQGRAPSRAGFREGTP